MAKKIKFPLEMKNDVLVKDLNELRENFDLDKVAGYFLDGKLSRWLEARYYDTEAEAIKNLNSNALDFKQQLCKIFDVDCPDISNTDTDFDAVAEHNRKLTALKQYTSDSNLLAKVDSVAFNQEDLADLLDEDVHDIYLCDNSFVIPLSVENKRYIGIGKVEAVIRSAKRIDFKSFRIEFENINFDPAYAKLHEQTVEELYQLGRKAEEECNYGIAFNYYQQSANLGHIEAMFKLADCYKTGKVGGKNYVKTMHWYKKIMQFTEYRARAMYNIGSIYTYEVKDIDKAITWYEKAANLGDTKAAEALTEIYDVNEYSYFASFGKKNMDKHIEWAEKAIGLGSARCCDGLISYDRYGPVACNAKNLTKVVQDIEKIAVQGDKDDKRQAMLYLGHIYSVGGNGVAKNPEKALAWYEKAANLGYTVALDRLGRIYMKGELVTADYFKAIEYFEKSLALEDSIIIVGVEDYFNDSDRSLEEFNKIVAQEEKSANLGNTWAMCRLAGLYYPFGIYSNTSFKMDSDMTKAIEWYEKAANLGSVAALYHLSKIFYDNYSDYKNFKKAVKWLEKTASDTTLSDHYRKMAKKTLGDIYMEGDDTLPKDVKKATEWYEKAFETECYSWDFQKIDYLKVLLE